MEQFNTIPTSGNWSDIAGILDANFFRCYTALVQSESLVGLSSSNFQGIYTSASTLPEMSSSGWALVGSSLSALTLYVYNTGSSEWGALNNVTYNFTDFSEFQTQLDALSSQLTQIGSKLDELEDKVEDRLDYQETTTTNVVLEKRIYAGHTYRFTYNSGTGILNTIKTVVSASYSSETIEKFTNKGYVAGDVIEFTPSIDAYYLAFWCQGKDANITLVDTSSLKERLESLASGLNAERLRLRQKTAMAYFSDAAVPTFSMSGGTLTMTLPNKHLYICSQDKGVLANIDLSTLDSRVFDFVNGRALVYDFTTETLSGTDSVSGGVIGDNSRVVLLLLNGYDIQHCSVMGALSGFFNCWRAMQIEDNSLALSDFNEYFNEYKSYIDKWRNNIQLEDISYFDSYVKGSTMASYWADRTFDLKSGVTYLFTFVPTVNIINNQSSSSTSDGYFSIKLANSNLTTLKAITRTGASAGEAITLDYTPSEDLTAAKVGSWNDRTNEATFDVYVKAISSEVSLTELYSSELGREMPFKRYNDFTALFFSDIHGASDNIGRIFDIANDFTPDAVLNGGDIYQYGPILSSGNSESIAWYNDAVDGYNGDVITTVGNHDAWDWTRQGGGVNLIPQTDAYNDITAKVISKVSGIVQPTGASTNGLNYFYKDYGNVRVIVLDSTYGGNVNLPATLGPAIQSYIDAQNTWLTSVLADAKTNDKTVVCMTHALNPSTITGKAVNKFGAFNDWRTVGNSYMIDGESKGTTDGISLAKSTFDIVQSFIENDNGKFTCWLVGHQHFDQSFYFTDYEEQPIFMISTARASYHSREGGSTTDMSSKMYDCFNAFGISTERGVVKFMRFGYNLDATLGKRDMMCYDYVHHTLLND